MKLIGPSYLNPRRLEHELKAILSTSDAVKAVAIVKKHLQQNEQPSTSEVST
jgi:hypothetical protein